MAVSFQEVLELNGKKLILNKYIKFFNRDGKNYAYLSRSPYKVSFMELSSKLLDIFRQFDGAASVNKILLDNSLSFSFFELVKTLYRNAFLVQSPQAEISSTIDTMSMTFFLTTNCNLRCVYCYAYAGEKKQSVIDIKKAGAWMNYIADNMPAGIKNVHVQFHGGGEPTAAFGRMKDIWQMAKDKFAPRGMEVKLSSISNGNFDEDVLEWFINEDVDLYFSMDGLENEHDRLRPRADGKSSFIPAVQNIKKLRESGVRVGLRCTVTNSNKNSLREFIDFGKELDAKFIHFEKCEIYGRETDAENKYIPNEEYKKIFFDVLSYGLKKDIYIHSTLLIPFKPGNGYYCNNFSNLSLALTSENTLTSCYEVCNSDDSASEHYWAGKINDDLSIEFYQDRLDKLRQRDTKNLKPCRECFLEYSCAGGCFMHSFRKTNGMMDVDESNCSLMQSISFELFKSMMTNPEMYNKHFNLSRFEYSESSNADILADYISYNVSAPTGC